MLFDHIHSFLSPLFLQIPHSPHMGWLDKGQALPTPGFYMLVPCLQICFWDEGASCPTRDTSDTRKEGRGMWYAAGE